MEKISKKKTHSKKINKIPIGMRLNKKWQINELVCKDMHEYIQIIVPLLSVATETTQKKANYLIIDW